MSLTEDVHVHWVDRGVKAEESGEAIWLDWCSQNKKSIMDLLLISDEYKKHVASMIGDHHRRDQTDAEKIIMLGAAGEKILSAWHGVGEDEPIDEKKLLDGVMMMARCLGYEEKQ